MIFHFCARNEWEGSADPYIAQSLSDEGFIHCSSIDQVTSVATAIEPGRADLVLLCLDESLLPVTWEDCYELGEKFPHVYGPIPHRAVVAMVPFPSDTDGSYSLPDIPA